MRPRWKLLLFAVALFGAHAILLRTMREDQIVASLFASGGSTGDVFVALVFVALRLTVYLAAPGLVLYALLRRRPRPAR
jgi:hypothetical protein